MYSIRLLLYPSYDSGLVIIGFAAEFVKHDFHFAGDKEKRDIYKLTLERGDRKHTFMFGQSLANSGIKIVNRNTGKTFKTFDLRDAKYLKNGKFDIMRFKFACGWQFASCDIIVKPVEPTEYDLLATLTKYDVGTLEDFCSEFGYDVDSKSAEKTYNAVCEEYLKVCAIFSPTEMEELQEIQ